MAMHACQIGPTDIALRCPGSPQWTSVETKGGTFWGRQPFCPHFSSATQCADGATTLSLRFGIDQDLRISGLDGTLAAGCLRSGPAWIIFCFRCWVADGKNDGGWQGLALGAGWQRLWAAPAASALSPSCGALTLRN